MTTPARGLVLGPLLRHVDRTSATIWVQTAQAGVVRVRCGAREFTAQTFGVHGFHYALVVVEGLEPGEVTAYQVDLDGEQVWPQPGSAFPPSLIATQHDGRATRLAFGSCRTSVPHDERGNATHGIDALRAYGVSMIERDPASWPHLLCFLGDQVYADNETAPALHEFIERRRDVSLPPYGEIKDYVEYAEVYRLAWSDPVVRWVLSTLPSAMIFDDHDVRDDWNTSWAWLQRIRQEPWWQERIVSALASYWVYQHIGNLTPADLAADEVWQQVAGADRRADDAEVDLTALLEEVVDRADKEPHTYRWSFTRDLGDAQLVMVDSRAARQLDPRGRSMLDAHEWEWLGEALRGDTRHLFIGSSLPVLLPPGLHDFEAMNEVMAGGRWGRLMERVAERMRQAIDLEHWAAFNNGFVDLMAMVMAVARGQRGEAPAVITFLSGDVHNSYVAEVTSPERHGARSRIVQAVCSPMRNPLPRGIRIAVSLLSRSLATPMRFVASRSTRIPDPTYPWAVTRGPWYDNCLATAEIEGDEQVLQWFTGEDVDGDLDRPVLRTVARVRVRAVASLRRAGPARSGRVRTRVGSGVNPRTGHGSAP